MYISASRKSAAYAESEIKNRHLIGLQVAYPEVAMELDQATPPKLGKLPYCFLLDLVFLLLIWFDLLFWQSDYVFLEFPKQAFFRKKAPVMNLTYS